MSDIKPVFAGEARLLRWNEGPNGRTVTLELDPDAGARHPFLGLPFGNKSGARMQLVAVLIDDNEEPVPPPQVGTNGADNHPAVKLTQANASIPEVAPEGLRERTPFRSLKRAAQAALKCQDPDFTRWLGSFDGLHGGVSEGRADEILKRVLRIKSKTELDGNQAKAQAWDKLLASFDYRDRVS